MLLSRSLKFAVLGLGLLAAGCDRQGNGEAQPAASASAPAAAQASDPGIDRSHKGSQLPDMVLSDPSGAKIKLADLKGKPLLINLWATWCAPCVAELPQLDAIAGEGTLKVLIASQDMETGKVAQFLKDRGVTRLEPWLDPENTLTTQYGVSSLPATILYDAQGREVWRYTGPRDWHDATSKAMLGEAG